MIEDVQHDWDRKKTVRMMEARSMCVCNIDLGLKHTDRANFSLQNKGDWTRMISRDI